MPTYRQKKQRLQQLVKQQQAQRILQIQQHGHTFPKVDAFRIAQKQYKYYLHRPTDFSAIIQPQQLKVIQVGGYMVYVLDQPQGVYLIKGFIGEEMQYRIGFEALNQFIRKPYRTNLDGTNGLYLEQNKEQKQQNTKEQQNTKQQRNQFEQQKQKQNNSNNAPTTNPKKQQQNPYSFKTDKSQPQISQQNGYFFDQRIRMANLGYQYDWPHRCYPKTQVPIPNSVRTLTLQAQILYQQISKTQLTYHGQAVIVNYYKTKDYMIGHLDDGEEDQQMPIFSLNFGLSCVFLVGFQDKMKPPKALKLDAGDLLIMSGPSRRCYHGVPRVIQNSYVPSKDKMQGLKEMIEKNKIERIGQGNTQQYYKNGYDQIVNYYLSHRLNLNVRQVWKHKEDASYQNTNKQSIQQ